MSGAAELLHPDKHPGKGPPAYGRGRPKDASDMPHPTTTVCAPSTSLHGRCVEAGIADERAVPITPTSKTRDSP